ncbi:MAG: hypothetical protein WDO17_18395 [Alphaproteobacteria bacterium]
MRRLAIGIILALCAAGVRAEELKPTLEQCTCIFEETAPPTSQRARAVNATLCVQTLDKKQKYCELTIACLRHNIGPNCGASSDPKRSILPLYNLHQDEVSKVTPKNPRVVEQLAKQAKEISTLTEQSGKIIDACVDAYIKQSPLKEALKDNKVSCGLNDGWLSIAFNFEGWLVKFSFGPRQ